MNGHIDKQYKQLNNVNLFDRNDNFLFHAHHGKWEIIR